MIRLRDISLPPEHSASQLNVEAARLLRLSPSKIRNVKLIRRSVDHRLQAKNIDVAPSNPKPTPAEPDEEKSSIEEKSCLN